MQQETTTSETPQVEQAASLIQEEIQKAILDFNSYAKQLEVPQTSTSKEGFSRTMVQNMVRLQLLRIEYAERTATSLGFKGADSFQNTEDYFLRMAIVARACQSKEPLAVLEGLGNAFGLNMSEEARAIAEVEDEGH